MANRLFVPFALLLLAGCASDIPRAIREAPPTDLRPAEALKDPQRAQGAAVRWGGTIASVENRHDDTWIEIVERPLWSDGEPRDTDRSEGRFLARVAGFLDPAVYAKGRRVTVAGTLDQPVTRGIGDFPYRYPVVLATAVQLWPRVVNRYYYYSPYWYDPWYPWGYPHVYPRYYVPPSPSAPRRLHYPF